MEAMFLPEMALLRRCQTSRRQFSSASYALVYSKAEYNGSQKQTTLNTLLEIEFGDCNAALYVKY